MKQVGFAARLLAVVAVLSLAAFVVAGCGSNNNSGNSSSSSSDTSSSGSGSSSTANSGSSSSGGTKNLQGQTVGTAKKVVVASNQDLNAEQQAIIAKIGDFADATASHNYAKICDMLTKKVKKQLNGGNCVQTFSASGGDIKDFKITVNSVKVNGSTAVADINVVSNTNTAQHQKFSLAKENGVWKIEVLGQ